MFRPSREAQVQEGARTVHQHLRTEESRAQTMGESNDRVLRWIGLDGPARSRKEMLLLFRGGGREEGKQS